MPKSNGVLRQSVITALGSLAAAGNDRTPQEIRELLQGGASGDRTSACWALAAYERDEEHRFLLSRDIDGSAPSIDPADVITEDHVRRYATVMGLAPDEVRTGYEQLQAKYGLRLAWQS